jgi:hypothetical protein
VKALALVVVGLVASVVAAGAANFGSLGYSEETTIVGPGTDACATGVLIHNHDGSFESAYMWQYAGNRPPYYGAFGESYDLGAGTVSCGVFWLTAVPGDFWTFFTDCYIWEGGTDNSPGAVVGVVADVVFSNIPYWPSVGQNDVEMNIPVTGPFTVGYWPDWLGITADWFCAADENGPGGHPWTCIAPGMGYPSGWQDPAIVWPNARSMGCGVYFEQGTPIESETWGAVKALFR